MKNSMKSVKQLKGDSSNKLPEIKHSHQSA